MNTALDKAQSAEATTLNVKRVIKAKRERIFDAWTKPELIAKWFGCNEHGKSNVTATADLWVGGAYRIDMGERDEHGNCTSVVIGTYTEIIPNERLCFTWGWPDNPAPETLVTVELRDVADGTEVTIRHERLENQDVRDLHAHGWVECLESLEQFLALSGSEAEEL